MPFYEDLLAEVEEADREVFKKYSDIAKKVNKNDELLTQWENWKSTQYDKDTGMTKKALEAIQQKDAEIEALKLLQGNEMTWDEMKPQMEKLVGDILKAQNVVDQNALKTATAPPVIKFKNADGTDREVPLADYVRNLEVGMQTTYENSGHLVNEYYREFADVADLPKFTIKDLFKHMQEKRITDFQAGFDSMVAPLRAKKSEAASKAREEQIRKEERETVKKELQMSGHTMPDDQKGPAPEMSALARKIADRKKVENPDQPKLTPGNIGDGSAGNDAYQQYLKDQAAGTKPSFSTGFLQ